MAAWKTTVMQTHAASIKYYVTITRTHARTHTRMCTFNGPFSGTTQVSRYQNGATIMDFTEASESEWQW